MPRRLRVASEGYAYQVLNRAVGKARIFGKQRDFEAFDWGDRRGQRAVADAGSGIVRAVESLAWRWSSLWHGQKAPPINCPLP